MKITFAEIEDTPVIHALAEEIWRATYSNILSKEQIDFMLNDMYTISSLEKQINSGVEFLLLSYEDNTLGFASLSNSEVGIFKIHKLYIHQSLQGKGAGRLMISYISNLAIQRGGDTLELNVNRNNPAKDFYIKLGFSIYKSEDIKYHQFVLNDYIMRKHLVIS